LSPALNAWTRVVVLLALLKVTAGLVAFFATAGAHPLFPSVPPGGVSGVNAAADPDAFPYLFFLFFLLSFGGAAIPLLMTGRGDHRAVTLAGFLLAVAAAYSNGPLREMADLVSPSAADLLRTLESLQLHAFMPFFLWSFVQGFPETTLPLRTRRLFHGAIQASLWTAIVLVLLNLVENLLRPALDRPGAGFARRAFTEITPRVGNTLFYLLIMPLVAGALAALFWKARRASGDENRRVQLLAGILVAGLAPAVLVVLCQLTIPAFGDYLKTHPRALLGVRIAAFIPAWLVPCGIAYAIIVHRVLGLRLVAREAVQYALARLSVLVLTAVPFTALCLSLYLQRGRYVEEVFSGRRLVLLAAATILGVVALGYRTRLLDAIDRRFFREQFDARQILTRVVQLLRSTHGAREIADLLCRGIDQALHLERITLLLTDPRSGDLIDQRSRARRLDASSQLTQLVAGASDPLPVDLEDPRSPVAGLPETDRAWLAEAGFHLLVPLVARDGSLLGFLGLGPKRSGLPFLREDRKLLESIAATAALGLELELSPRPVAPPRAEEGLAAGQAASAGLPGGSTAGGGSLAAESSKECPSCGALFLPYTVFCGHCSRRLEPALVPYVLPGKFRFERRIGAGGMGLVYRGSDLALGRAVAIKTLRRVSPEDALRLRREARTAASVSHPHLAGVFGVETWQGTPMLVMEFMEGGTLTQRIEKGPFEEGATVELGLAMAAALEHLHAAHILHRDIKPSNIGFSRDGVPKLMDFGIARLMFDLRREGGGTSEEPSGEETPVLPPTSIWDRSPTSITRSRQLVGTLSYLSPEALEGEPADASFDLWSLCLVLYECLLGRKIFTGAEHKQLLARIRNGRVPDFEQALPDGDPALGAFFREALHRTPARRPASARDLRKRLEQVRSQLGEARATGSGR
jgi:Protein kinase domain/GAF domain